MAIEFHWDPVKGARKRLTHRVSFDEASTVFGDPHALTDYDEGHSTESEDRWLIVGLSDRGRVLLVVYTEISGIIRIISAWRAYKREIDGYQQARSQR